MRSFSRNHSTAPKKHGHAFIPAFLILLLCSLILCSCGTKKAENPTVYDVEYQGDIYTLDTGRQYITYLDKEYPYEVTSNSITVSVNNTKFTNDYAKTGGSVMSMTSVSGDNPDITTSMLAQDLLSVIYEEYLGENGSLYTNPHSFAARLIGLVLLGIGILNICAPRAAWWCSYGWRYGWHFKNAEPSEASLRSGRIMGVIAVVVGLLILIFA